MRRNMVNALFALPVFFSAQRNLKKTQWLESTEIEGLQMRKLRHLLAYSYENVPHFHSQCKDRKIRPEDIIRISDMSKLPLLGKEMFNANPVLLQSRSYPPGKLFPYSTGGSTGEPTRFMHDWDSLPWIEAANDRFFSWAGKKILSKIVALSPPRSGVVNVARRIKRERTLTLFGGDEKRLLEILRVIEREKPSGLKGYATSLHFLAEFIRKHDLNAPEMDFIISSSEMLTTGMRHHIEDVFGCEVFDNYGSREFAIAAECEMHSGLHIAAENLLVEVIDPVSGESLGPGEKGELIVTDFTRFGMPLIRYRVGDLGQLSEETCSCNRSLPRIEKLQGRVTEMLVTSDGRHLPGVAIVTMIFKDVHVSKFKVVQKKKDSLILFMVKGNNYSGKDEDFILTKFRDLDPNLNITIEYVEEIEPTSSGKHIVVQSEVNRFK